MRSRLKLALVVLGAPALVGAFYGVRAMDVAIAKRDASLAFARFGQCLVGDPIPKRFSPQVEPPSERLRRIALGVAARATSAPDVHDAWPERCAPFARKLHDAWTHLSYARDDAARAHETNGAVLAPLAVLGEAIARGALVDSHGDVVDALFASAALELAPRPEAAGDAPSPPTPATPITLKGVVEPISRDDGLVSGVDALPGRTLRLRFSGKDDVCVFGGDADPARTLLRASCLPIHAGVPPRSRDLVGLDDAAAPLLASGTLYNGGVYAASSGERVLAAGTPSDEGAYGRADGFVAALDRTVAKPDGPALGDAYALVRRLPSGATSRTPLDRPHAAKDRLLDARVVGDAIVWVEGPQDGDGDLFARAIGDGERAAGPIVSIGKVPARVSIDRHPAACRTAEALFVDLRGGASHVLVVRAADRWRALPTPEGTGGRLTCHGGEAVYTSARPGGAVGYDKGPLEIVQTRCTIERCERSIARLTTIAITRDDVDGANAKVAVTDIAGSVALAWMGRALFLRVAPLRELATAPTRVLVDASSRANGFLIVHGINLPTRQDAAVLLLNTSDGAFALRVDARGEVAPVEVDR